MLLSSSYGAKLEYPEKKGSLGTERPDIAGKMMTPSFPSSYTSVAVNVVESLPAPLYF